MALRFGKVDDGVLIFSRRDRRRTSARRGRTAAARYLISIPGGFFMASFSD
jgi:hypothetical protein